MQRGRVLITGIRGFTGRYVASEFADAGWEVWGTGRAPAQAGDPKYKQLFLEDGASLKAAIAEIAPDAVLHLAAVSFIQHGSADDFYRINVLGSRNLLSALAETGHGHRGIVLASSANIYGNAVEMPIGENAPPNPTNDYAISKLAMEHIGRLFKDKMPVMIARPFNYTGRKQDPKFLVPKIVSHFLEKKPEIELGNIDVARDFSDVRDVAKSYRMLLEKAPNGETVNICSGTATSLADIIATCQSITGHEIRCKVNPAFVRENEIKKLMGDTSKFDDIVGRFEKRDINQTIAWMLKKDSEA